MVDNNPFSLCFSNGVAHFSEPVQRVEVQTEYDVSAIDGCIGRVQAPFMKKDGLRLWHPTQEIRKGIGHDDGCLFADAAQILGPTQTGADGIAVRTAVSTDYDVVSLSDYLYQL